MDRGFWIAARGFVSLNVELSEADFRWFVEAVRGFVEMWARELLLGWGES